MQPWAFEDIRKEVGYPTLCYELCLIPIQLSSDDEYQLLLKICNIVKKGDTAAKSKGKFQWYPVHLPRILTNVDVDFNELEYSNLQLHTLYHYDEPNNFPAVDQFFIESDGTFVGVCVTIEKIPRTFTLATMRALCQKLQIPSTAKIKYIYSPLPRLASESSIRIGISRGDYIKELKALENWQFYVMKLPSNFNLMRPSIDWTSSLKSIV